MKKATFTAYYGQMKRKGTRPTEGQDKVYRNIQTARFRDVTSLHCGSAVPFLSICSTRASAIESINLRVACIEQYAHTHTNARTHIQPGALEPSRDSKVRSYETYETSLATKGARIVETGYYQKYNHTHGTILASP